MKTTKIVYWTATGALSMMMAFSAFAYLTQDEIKQAFLQLGFPGFFRIELAIAKLIGVAVLVLPLSGRIKEWAYAGFAITFISAVVAHVAGGLPASTLFMPAIAIILLAVSYVTFHKLKDGNGKSLTQSNLDSVGKVEAIPS